MAKHQTKFTSIVAPPMPNQESKPDHVQNIRHLVPNRECALPGVPAQRSRCGSNFSKAEGICQSPKSNESDSLIVKYRLPLAVRANGGFSYFVDAFSSNAKRSELEKTHFVFTISRFRVSIRRFSRRSKVSDKGTDGQAQHRRTSTAVSESVKESGQAHHQQ